MKFIFNFLQIKLNNVLFSENLLLGEIVFNQLFRYNPSEMKLELFICIFNIMSGIAAVMSEKYMANVVDVGSMCVLQKSVTPMKIK